MASLQSLLTCGTCSGCALHSPFLCPLLGSTIFRLYWLSEAELGLASVALTRMFYVPATHSVVLYSSLAKGRPLLLPLCSQGFIVLKNKLIYFPGLKVAWIYLQAYYSL